MTKMADKNRAIELRKHGLSYNEIREKVKVSKSSLSLWLRSVELAKRHQRRITEKQRAVRLKGVAAWHNMRIEKTLRIKQSAQAQIKTLSEREKWLIGISLYWAEGTKEREKGTRIHFTNSDPAMILLFREWLFDFLQVSPEDVVYSLFIHEKSQNRAMAMQFWVNFLGIDLHELRLVLKKHNTSPKRKNVNENYVGLIKLTVRRSIDLTRKISGWIDGIIAQIKPIGE